MGVVLLPQRGTMVNIGETAIAIVAVLLPQRGSVVTIELQSSGQKILILETKDLRQTVQAILLHLA